MKGWAIINPKYQIIRSHPTPCGTVTHFFNNNISCHSICTPKSAMMSLISFLKSCFPSFFFFLLQMTLNTTMFAVSHFFGLSAERQHKIFSLSLSEMYPVFPSAVRLANENLQTFWFTASSMCPWVPFGKELLVLWLAAIQWGGKRLLRFTVFVLPRKLQKNYIKTIWTDILQLLAVLCYYYFSSFDYSLLKISSKA